MNPKSFAQYNLTSIHNEENLGKGLIKFLYLVLVDHLHKMYLTAGK